MNRTDETRSPTTYRDLDTPIGKLRVVERDGKIVKIDLPHRAREAASESATVGTAECLDVAQRQLEEYFDGEREEFDLPLEPNGTPFQKAVWDELCRIGFGEVISYQELATRVGRPKASRAVGAANGKNPIAIVVPCHRVIGSDGTLTGYAGGIETKAALLRLEGVAGLDDSSRSQLRLELT